MCIYIYIYTLFTVYIYIYTENIHTHLSIHIYIYADILYITYVISTFEKVYMVYLYAVVQALSDQFG